MNQICNECKISNMRSSNGLNWKGGEIVDSQGYVMVWMPNHPMAHKSGYIKRAHLVIESVTGRHVRPGEDVHHINGVKDDDRAENLQLMTHSQHTTRTNRELKKAQHMGQFRRATNG